jgi:signal transduction histidine kinase
VLLVDDRPDNLLALRAVLDPLRFDLIEASSGEEALRRLLSEEFALIVLDVQMPVLDGFETARLIKRRERTRHLPIIFLTAISGEAEHYLQGYESGAVDYVYKPFEPDILRAKVVVFAEWWSRGAIIEAQRQQLAARVAELDQAHTELARQAVELERSNTALERFAAQAGNEISGPLHTAAGLLELFGDRYAADLSGEGALLVERATAVVERARGQVAELLEFARASTGGLERRPVDLEEVVSEARAGLEAELEATGGSLTVNHLPVVDGDRSQLVRLLTQLLDNAVRHRGSKPPEVRVEAEPTRSAWRVSISDNGPGIRDVDRPRLFTVWGSGFGLALCRRIVERHGGRIGVDTSPEGGTTIWFELAASAGGSPPPA